MAAKGFFLAHHHFRNFLGPTFNRNTPSPLIRSPRPHLQPYRSTGLTTPLTFGQDRLECSPTTPPKPIPQYAAVTPKPGGLLFCSVGNMRCRRYNKQPLSIDDQIQRLQDYGMRIDDAARAKRYLTNIGYYRLSAYWLPFEPPCPPGESRLHQFQLGTTFDQVLSLYIFDRKLRLRPSSALKSRYGHTGPMNSPCATGLMLIFKPACSTAQGIMPATSPAWPRN